MCFQQYVRVFLFIRLKNCNFAFNRAKSAVNPIINIFTDMKSLKVFLVAAAAVLMTAVPASAQLFRFGPKIGTQVSSMKFDESVLDGENRAGFTGGVMVELNVPIIGLGFDLSAMYVHRSNAIKLKDGSDVQSKSSDYIDIPLHVKYKIGLPIVGKVLSPYVFTGPCFAVRASKAAIVEGAKAKSADVAWDFGIGLQLFNHLQIGASYGLGMNKTLKALPVGPNVNAVDLDAKTNCWTITAAWLF